ncbi:energy transducer TonB [Novosphingobium fluoreni]|uniref:energy transducer TonB n=1 Tax=Novosphingobium fluoreni TaxID=1391222 RepID=UPI001C856509|nr:energy transducer TonB [Novosphingobium fluoreni]
MNGISLVYAPSPRQRATSALASLVVVGSGGLALVFGLSTAAPISKAVQETLIALNVAPEPLPAPPPRPEITPQPEPTQADKPESARLRDEASPENLRNKATAVFAPVVTPLRIPPPIIAAPRPMTGDAGNTGASDRVGPGQGAGGFGDGFGGGGNGDGGNGDSDAITRPIQIRGKLYWSDLPRELRDSHRGGELELHYLVGIDGRVRNCRVIKSSGVPSLDARTCQLITERFRFKPSLDARGRPVVGGIIENHGWDPSPEDTISDDDDRDR